MKEIAGGILLGAGILFIVIPFLTIVIGLVISHILNAITPGEVITDGLMNICWFIGFLLSIFIIYYFWWL